MSMKTEGDIPGLFRQFSGNSANYQELTRAAAARASQARWPLLSAVDLERGDIPAVGESVAAPVDAAPVPHGEVRPLRGMTRLAGAIAPAQSAPTELEDDIPTPAPVVLPGNTIFMAPAPHTARHFAQIERTLAQRRESEMADMAAPVPLPIEDVPSLDSDPVVPATLPTLSDVIVETPVRADAPAAVSELAPPVALPEIATTAAPSLSDFVAAVAPGRHAGLKPLFDRLAGNAEDKASVDSLFSRLMRS